MRQPLFMQMKKRFIILCTCSFLFFISAAAQSGPDTIVWSPKRLAWTDFREVVTYDKYYRKLAKTRWYMHYQERDDSLTNEKHINVAATFICNHSWVRKTSTNNYVLLAHEQLHFDITEIFARRLRKELSSLKGGEALARRIEKIKSKTFSKLHNMQADYDLETAGGNKPDMQKWWYDFIVKNLQQLESFGFNEIVVPLK